MPKSQDKTKRAVSFLNALDLITAFAYSLISCENFSTIDVVLLSGTYLLTYFLSISFQTLDFIICAPLSSTPTLRLRSLTNSQ